jgi:UDP-N-acetylglucosamine 2-epimerase (non-hydrolysing)
MIKELLVVIGARPNFVKAAPLLKKLYFKNIKFKILHSGQHFDQTMSKNILKDLGIFKIDYKFKIKSKNSSERFSEILNNFRKFFLNKKFKAVIVFGDVNTSVCASIIAKNFNLNVFHIESGLRSFDSRMPEETNRIIIDHCSDLHFVTEESAYNNLTNEKFRPSTIKFVGNLMIENLIQNQINLKRNIITNKYVVVTIHRAENILNKKYLKKILVFLKEISKDYEVFFPLHPSTRKQIAKFDLSNYLKQKNFKILKPLSYLKFISLMKDSEFILTDSGGIQEEAAFLKKKIFTLRDNTERPITLVSKYNNLVKLENLNKSQIYNKLNIKNKSFVFKKWDLNVSDRIIKEINKFFNEN